MGYILLWIESLAVSLLLVATLLACTAQWQGRKPAVFSVLLALLPCLAYAGLTGLAAYLQFEIRATDAWFYPTLALTLVYCAGAVWILRYGLRRAAADLRAAAWSREKLAMGLAVVVALHLMTFWNMDLTVRQELAGLYSYAGRLALSVAPAPVLARDNAAVVYQQAFEAMGSQEAFEDAWSDEWDEWLEPSGEDFDPEDTAMRQFLDKQRLALALLRRATEKPGCYFDRDYQRPNFGVVPPQLAGLGRSAKLLAMDARLKAAQGDTAAALQDVQAMFVMAEHGSTDPTLIALLVSQAIDGRAVGTLEGVLNAGSVSPDALAALKIDEWISYRRLLNRSFRMEEAFGQAIFCQFGTTWEFGVFDEDLQGAFRPLSPLYRVFLLSEDLEIYRSVMGEVRTASDRPFHEAQQELDRLSAQWQAKPRGLLNAMIVPALVRCAEHAARADAHRGLARLALAMLHWRTAHGRFPSRLEELAPDVIAAVPRDPFDGTPLKLKQADRGLVLYSIGPDMTDDGGIPIDKEAETGDITFELPAP
jgi:hypothetical protein